MVCAMKHEYRPQVGDSVTIDVNEVRGEYLEPDGSRRPRHALSGPWRVVEVAGDRVVMIYDLVPEIFETTVDELAKTQGGRGHGRS